MHSSDTTDVVIHVGPSLRAHGGIASVMRAYRNSELGRCVDLRFLATTHPKARALTPVVFAASFLSARRLAARYGPRAVFHVHTASSGSFRRKAAVMRAVRTHRSRVVLHLHGGGFADFAERSSAVMRARISEEFTLADAVVVLSSQWLERVARLTGRDDLLVIDNPVAIPECVPPLGHGGLFLGRLSRAKGILDLVEAIRLMQVAGRRDTWVLAGDRPDAGLNDAVRRLPYPELVSLPGWLGEEEVHKAMIDAAVYCLPSYAEGKPVALLEAMGYGRACVATPVGGVPDVIVDRENGLLTPAGDIEALSAALTTVFEDADLRARLGSAAHTTVRARYATEMVVERLIELYRVLGLRIGGECR